MIAIALTLLAAQTPPAAEANPAPQVAPAQSRAALDTFGSCVAVRAPLKASRTLNLDFTTRQYDDALRALVRENRICIGSNRQARVAGVLAAGSIAEGLLEADGGRLLAQLPQSATASVAAPHSPSDQAMMCVIRRSPADIARLFGTAPATAEEKTAVAAITPALSPCLEQGTQARLNTAGLRAVLATAAYRMVAAPAAPKS